MSKIAEESIVIVPIPTGPLIVALPVTPRFEPSNVRFDSAVIPPEPFAVKTWLLEPETVGDVPEEPEVPEDPDEPDEPDDPEDPLEPELPEVPEEPDVPELPLVPELPDTPVAPVGPNCV
jgi:hypothetical protein